MLCALYRNLVTKGRCKKFQADNVFCADVFQVYNFASFCLALISALQKNLLHRVEGFDTALLSIQRTKKHFRVEGFCIALTSFCSRGMFPEHGFFVLLCFSLRDS